MRISISKTLSISFYPKPIYPNPAGSSVNTTTVLPVRSQDLEVNLSFPSLTLISKTCCFYLAGIFGIHRLPPAIPHSHSGLDGCKGLTLPCSSHNSLYWGRGPSRWHTASAVLEESLFTKRLGRVDRNQQRMERPPGASSKGNLRCLDLMAAVTTHNLERGS